MNSIDGDLPPLIRTKLRRPRLGRDLVPRPHLIERLNRGMERKLTLISAQAGAGKTTLLSQWLQECPKPSAWLSLDEHDNDLMVFLGYLCAAIRTVFPHACEQALDLLKAPQQPPARIVTTLLVNELDNLIGSRRSANNGASSETSLILALDDYQNITDPAIQELLSELVAYLPQGVHLALTSRTDPPLPLARLRAGKEMNELRTDDLRFTTGEARALLELTAGRELSKLTVDLLEENTDGWAVGLRLAALSLRKLPDDEAFAESFSGTGSSTIVDYLLGEVLTLQSPEQQDFLLQTSILDQFKADLCGSVFRRRQDTQLDKSRPDSSQDQLILQELVADNLFTIALDQEGHWFRYHHLFRSLLQLRLKQRYSEAEIAALHTRASEWFDRHDYLDDALEHALLAGSMDRAVELLARRRYALMNQARWQELESYLRRFPPQVAEQHPELLMLNAWLLHHRGHYEQLPAALAKVEASVGQTSLSEEAIRHLHGESSALTSLLSYYSIDEEQTFAAATFAINNTPPELWIIRILARLTLAGAYQMKGELRRAYRTILGADDEEVVESNRFKPTILMTSCYIYWLAADLTGLLQVGNQCLELLDFARSNEIKGYVHYHLGCAYYQRNDLDAAEEHFAVVARQPHLNYGDCYAHSAFGLALIHLAQNRAEDASELASSTVDYLLETSNMTLLPLAQAFQAELALRQGSPEAADQWAAQFDAPPPLSAMIQLYQYQFTLVSVWLTQNTPESRKKVANSLNHLRAYTESANNTLFLIEVLARQALLYATEGDEQGALTLLQRALELAQPGGFIRLFVDLGPSMERLLQLLLRQALSRQPSAAEYVRCILAAFPGANISLEPSADGRYETPAPALLEPLTVREEEVLELLARRLTNKEIADRLIISIGTVKTHTLSIYAKLDVHGRRQAVKKAEALGLLTAT